MSARTRAFQSCPKLPFDLKAGMLRYSCDPEIPHRNFNKRMSAKRLIQLFEFGFLGMFPKGQDRQAGARNAPCKVERHVTL